MDTDSSSEENSSSECSTDSSDDDKLETAQICDLRVQLPQGLCERKDIFDEFFSVQTWNSMSDSNKQHLTKFLPAFPENDEHEKSVALQKLFNGDMFRFNSPLVEFHEHLKAGHFRPDIAKMRMIIKKAERRESRHRYRSYRECLKQELIESRKKLLNLVRNLPPGVEPKLERLSTINSSYVNPVAYRTKRRYFQELSTIRSKVDETGFSSDENYPDGPPVSLSRKQKRHLNSIRNSQALSSEKVFVSTMASKPTGLDLERYITPNNNPFFINEDSYKNLLMQHKRRKLEHSDDVELDTKGITMSDIVHRTQLPYVKKLSNLSTNSSKLNANNRIIHRKKIKRESVSETTIHEGGKPKAFFVQSSNSELDSDSDSYVSSNSIKHRSKLKSRQAPVARQQPNKVIKTEIKSEPVDSFYSIKANSTDNTSSISKSPYSQYGKITPATFSDLDGIDMMNLPIDLEDSNIDILELNNKPELMQETHASFLSLIRDIICSTTEHRMNMSTLEERLKSWQENPISPLNDWYNISENWVGLLQSAVNFLSGNFPEQPEDFVPYIEYKPQLDVYQWIGAGRDSDNSLSPLSQYWLDHRNEIKPTVSHKEKEDIDVEVIDRSQTPPPPRFPTTWTVRKADPEEIKSFREQERRRYDNPHKAFTYRCNGYESVVGPLKGIYNPSVGNTKARGHNMLSADRPNFVTILSLVRDATARLPNGEGTRADICELLKSSQYISSTAPDNVLQSVVSGALDRMHTQFDPCVKYDQKRKIWIYLHRSRSEEDFERLHQQYQGMNKSVKKCSSKSRTPTKPKQKVEKTVKNNKISTTVSKAESPSVVDKVKIAKSKINVTTAATNSAQASSSPSPSSSRQASSILLPTKILSVEDSPQEATLLQEVSNTSQQEIHTNIKRLSSKPLQKQNTIVSQQERDINEALQAIAQNQSTSPVPKHIPNQKPGKNLVKMISTSHGKSLIIPSSNSASVKHIQDQKIVTSKLSQPQIVTHQLLQTIAAQQKQTIQIIPKSEAGDTVDQKIQNKVPVSIQQQIFQSISPQQFQNIKNVTLLRSIAQAQGSPNQNVTPVSLTLAQTSTVNDDTDEELSHIVVQANSPTATVKTLQQVQSGSPKLQTATTLTPAQQQQILHTLKQKVLPLQTTVLNPQQQQQQIILKQKAAVAQLQLQKQVQHAPGTSLLGQPRISTEGINTKPVITSAQAPVVAKVLTNAAGQVISVSSLLAHQKQHGTLPHGTTLRVSGAKGGQANIIQLSPASKGGGVAQFTVSSQNNFITLTNQPKLVVASQTTTVTSSVTVTKPTSKMATKTQTITKFPTKVAQQLINAKFITQSLDGQKIVQPKIVMTQQNQLKAVGSKGVTVTKPVTLSVNANANTIRMVNAANLNFTHIGGKPVLLAGKGSSIQTIQGQNVILQTQSNSSGNLVIQNTGKTLTDPSLTQHSNTSNVNLLSQNAQVVIAPQLKMQAPQVVLSSNLKSGSVNMTQQNASQGQIMLGGSPVRLQTSSSGNAQRVVLASSNQGGQIVAQQILLPAGFQGAAINIKALQGVKVIPIAHTQHGKNIQGRQVFARLMNPAPANIVRTSQTTSVAEVINETPPTSE